MFPRFAAIIALFLVTSPALADPAMDHSMAQTRDLLESCTSPASTLRAMCLGYLAAVSDDIDRDHVMPGNKLICRPRPVELEIYRRAFVEFATAAPDYRERSSFDAVKAALARRWPCPGAAK